MLNGECEPSQEYMNWFTSFSFMHVADIQFVNDPRQHASSSTQQTTPSIHHDIPQVYTSQISIPDFFNRPTNIPSYPNHTTNTHYISSHFNNKLLTHQLLKQTTTTTTNINNKPHFDHPYNIL